MAIQEILNDNNINNKDKQLKIEDILHNTWINIYIESFEKNPKMLNETSIQVLHEFIQIFLKHYKLAKTGIKRKDDYKILFSIKDNRVCLIIFSLVLPLINTYSSKKYSTFIMEIAEAIVNESLKTKYSIYRKNCKTQGIEPISYSIYKKEDENFIDNKIKVNIGTLLLKIVLDSSFLLELEENKISSTETELLVKPCDKALEIYSKKLDLIGLKLPMVCSPVKWSKEHYGGYFKNDETFNYELIHQSSSILGNSKPVDSKILHQINYLSSVPFKVNKAVLNYIEKYGIEQGLILEDIHEYTNKPFPEGLTKAEIKALKKDILSHNSKYYLQRNILAIAHLYKNVEAFYLPMFYDWRGRIYTQPDYLSYQGNELAKALLLFADPDVIQLSESSTYEALMLFKAYGAECYGYKGSFLYKSKMIDHLNLQRMEFKKIPLDEAKNKILFLAFALEYKKYLIEKSLGQDFYSYLPIQLDASCNGLQHLAAIIQDANLANSVNLLAADFGDTPRDVYADVKDIVSKKLLEISKDSLYTNLKNVNLTREIIKKPVMATSYGITESGIKEYLEQELFQKEYVVVDKNFIFRSRDLEKFGNFSLTTREANKLAKIIHSCLFDLHPKLLEFVNYLNEIVEILYKLELPIIWIAPSGIKVNHTYKKFKTERISSSAYKGARRVTLQVPITKANLQNIKKGIVPNLIHSLDASNISILISHLKNQKLTHPVNLYTVHDCFATSIDKLPLINHLVREAFIDIYSSDSYISDFNNFVVQYIEKNNIEIVETKVKENDLYINKKGVIIPETNEMIYLPEVPKINNIPYFSKQVKQACYMIS